MTQRLHAAPCIAKAAEDLQDTLGRRLTAYALGLRDPGLISSFARREADPPTETAGRLWDLHAITSRLLECRTAECARAWMSGSSPLLDHRAPLEVLHEHSRQAAQPPSTWGGGPDAFQRVDHAVTVYLHAL